MATKTEILKPDKLFYVHGRANGSEKLFLTPNHYEYFLENFKKHILPVAEIWSYCLMPNYYQFMLEIRGKDLLMDYFSRKYIFANIEDRLLKLISQQFGNMLNAYSHSFNLEQGRKGSLFMHPYKRKHLRENKNIQSIIKNIHMNPVNSQLCNDPNEWSYSSYNAIASQKSEFLEIKQVLKLYGGLQKFIDHHMLETANEVHDSHIKHAFEF